MIGIIDYGCGNLCSVQNAFLKIYKKAEIVKKADNLKKYDKLILPGVGAFSTAMENLKKNDIDFAIKDFIKSGKYILGICLGMQLLFEKSEEFGSNSGLCLIEGEVKKFNQSKFDEKLKVPQVGWNKMNVKKDILFSNLPDFFYLYFVHSYHVTCDEKYIIGKTNYGYEFTSAVRKDNILGFQPHPEKSHDVGLQILKNYTEL